MPLPNFSICGAPKAGTTALNSYLRQHPDILMSSVKETDFFQHNYSKGLDWFESHFHHWSGEKAVGEASPGNMADLQAPERIAKHIPNAKLVFILRNPVERAYSQYLYGFHRGDHDTEKSFSELIRDHYDEWGQRILSLGQYYGQLENFRQFFSEKQMLILLYDDFRVDTRSEVSKVFRFLGVDDRINIDTSCHLNKTKFPRHLGFYRIVNSYWNKLERSASFLGGERIITVTSGVRRNIKRMLYSESLNRNAKMKTEDKLFLLDYYRESTIRLSEMLGRDLSDWLE